MTQPVAILRRLVSIKTIVLYRFCNEVLWQIFHWLCGETATSIVELLTHDTVDIVE